MKHTALIAAFMLLAWPVTYASAQVTKTNIFPLQDKHVHGSSIVQLPSGDFIAVWFYGSGERSADDVKIQGARLNQGESKWQPVFEAADVPGFPDCNPVLHVDDQGRLHMFWITVLANAWERSLLKQRTAASGEGEGAPDWTWQEQIQLDPGASFAEDVEAGLKATGYPEPMWAEYAYPYTEMIVEAAKDKLKRQMGWMTRIHPLRLASGRLLLPLYSDGFNVSLAALSDDGGDSWTASKPIVGLGPIQPTFVQKKNGDVVAYMRDSGALPSRVLTSTSSDEGMTWTTCVDTDIPNPSSSLEVIALEDGRWVMICNDTERGRNRLALLMSGDEGATWGWKRYLEDSPDRIESYAYPSMFQAKDGTIHATYSYKHEDSACIRHTTFTADWITQGE